MKSKQKSKQKRKQRTYAHYDPRYTAKAWQGLIAEVLFILLMCALPLFLGSDRYIGLSGQKFWFFFACMCLASVSAVIVWMYRILGQPKVLPEERLAVTDWAVLAFAALTLLSAVLSPYRDVANVWIGKPEPNGRYDGAITQCMYVLAFLIISKWYKPRQRDFIIFGVSVMIISLLGIFQFHGMDFLKLWPNHIPMYERSNFYRISFRTTLGNINIVSAYACVAVLLCAVLSVKSSSKWRYLWLVSSALAFWLLILARSDSGVVGSAVAAALSLPLIIRSVKELGKLLITGSSFIFIYVLHHLLYTVNVLGLKTAGSFLPLAALFIIMLAAGIALSGYGKDAAPGAPPDLKPRIIIIICIIAFGFIAVEFAGRGDTVLMIYQLREILHGRIDDSYASTRIYIWRSALEAFPGRPMIGSGPDTFLHALSAEAQSTYLDAYGNVLDKAHNEYLQILVCQGLPALACYLVFLGGVFAKALRRIHDNELLAAAAVAFAGYCVLAFFNISLPGTGQMVWVLAGVMAAFASGQGANADPR